jgi:hypothetical protein
MQNKSVGFKIICLSAIILMLAGCGSNGSGEGLSSAPAAAIGTVTGVAAVGLPLSGTVNLKDSSTPARELTAQIGTNGDFSFDVTGMQAPYILQAMGTANGTNFMLYSFTGSPGIANINPMSNVVIAIAGGVTDPARIFSTPDPATLQKVAAVLPTAISALNTQLLPLLNLYGVAGIDPVAGSYLANSTGLDAMFDAVNIELSAGVVTVTNRNAGNAVIFTAPVNNISNGTFIVGNMPVVTPIPAPTPAPSPIDGAALYTANCSACHGPLATSAIMGLTADVIQTALGNTSGPMGPAFTFLTTPQIQAIAAALSSL